MTRPADASQRAEALDLTRSFIVQAPAGSGKTELLTQRFLKLLARVDRPERILAITFTRKATREMHERIVRRLHQAHKGMQPGAQPVQENGDEHERLAIELARAVLQRDREQGWQLLKNPGRLRVYTIDGLCVQLLARDPERGSHVAGRSVLEDPKPLYRRAVQNLFEHLGQATAAEAQSAAAREALVRLLVHLDGNAPALQDLLVSMLAVRDQWTRKMGIDSATLQEVLQDRQEQELAHFRTALGADTAGAGPLAAAMHLVAALGQSLDDPGCAAAEFSLATAQKPGSLADGLRLAHLFSKLFLTAGDAARKPGGISRSLFKGVSAADAALIPELKAIYTQWFETAGATAALQRMALTPPVDLGTDNTALRDDIRQVLAHTLAHLHLLFAGQGVADFQFMAENALECLGDADNPGQVLLDEDVRLEHILMDEFQDTSNTQFELLSRLMAGWEAEGSRSLFLVGDPMQSIYRFREANVGLFIDVVQRGRVADIPLHYRRLESNFRSSREIVDWVNRQFNDIFPKHNERDSGAVSYAHTHAEVGPGGQVQVHPLGPDSSDQDEARLAVELIRQAQAELQQPKIAVLARARSHLAALAQALTEQGIEFEAVKVDSLASRPVVNDLLAITRALIHPADRVAWLALLRAPWCGLSTRELHRLAGEDPRGDLFELMRIALDLPDDEISRKPQLRRLQRTLS
ncbi:MAG TPA: UvrD-helicase domain-containing protein, partial [Xanthomonadales bacterium]|nr:UvrD-helicase domain-containing protein [Xanthomonadales bacterium]